MQRHGFIFLAILNDSIVFFDPENMVIEISDKVLQGIVTKLCRQLFFSIMATPHLHERYLKKMLKCARGDITRMCDLYIYAVGVS